jgi:hypothetical protein
MSSKKVLSFRVRFRKKGYPDQIESFPDEDQAKKWLAKQQHDAFMGIHFPKVRSSKHTLAEAIDRYRYITEELPRKPGNARNVRQHLEWFRKELGDYALSATRPSLINKMKTKLANDLLVSPRSSRARVEFKSLSCGDCPRNMQSFFLDSNWLISSSSDLGTKIIFVHSYVLHSKHHCKNHTFCLSPNRILLIW